MTPQGGGAAHRPSHLGTERLKEDGIHGEKTRAAVRQYQTLLNSVESADPLYFGMRNANGGSASMAGAQQLRQRVLAPSGDNKPTTLSFLMVAYLLCCFSSRQTDFSRVRRLLQSLRTPVSSIAPDRSGGSITGWQPVERRRGSGGPQGEGASPSNLPERATFPGSGEPPVPFPLKLLPECSARASMSGRLPGLEEYLWDCATTTDAGVLCGKLSQGSGWPYSLRG